MHPGQAAALTVTSSLRSGSGVPGSWRSHTVYSQPSRVTTRRNSVRAMSPGRLISSSAGANLKNSGEER